MYELQDFRISRQHVFLQIEIQAKADLLAVNMLIDGNDAPIILINGKYGRNFLKCDRIELRIRNILTFFGGK